MSASVLLVVMFVMMLVIITWLLNQLPKPLIADFDAIHRHSPLDGIRGILALLVFTHHFLKNYSFQTTGRWQLLADEAFGNLATNLGSVPVSLFFLITGYLFFSKLKQPNINWYYLYRSRIQRIVPLYLFLGVGIVVIYISQHHAPLPASQWQQWLVRWLSFNNQSLNGFFAWPLVAGAAWTLLYEWGFYFCLPLLFLIMHPKQASHWRHIAMAVISLPILYGILTHTYLRLYWLFALAAFAVWLGDMIKALLNQFTVAVSGGLCVLTLFIFLGTQAYSYWQMGFCAVLFCFIANGFDYMGGLSQQGLKVLGELSYSLYLTHGLVMYGFYNVLSLHDFGQPLLSYLLTYPLMLVLVVLFAVISYRTIEKPLMYRPSHPNKSA